MAAMCVRRRRNPQDATLRNIRALKARVSALERQVKFHARQLRQLTRDLARSAR